MKLATISFVLLLLFSSLISASEKADACVKYQTNSGWSKGYSVQATVISGSDLNTAVGSLSRFRAFSTYAVVFWDKGEASIFELPPASFENLPMFEHEVNDQSGRKWKIKQGHTLCY